MTITWINPKLRSMSRRNDYFNCKKSDHYVKDCWSASKTLIISRLLWLRQKKRKSCWMHFSDKNQTRSIQRIKYHDEQSNLNWIQLNLYQSVTEYCCQNQCDISAICCCSLVNTSWGRTSETLDFEKLTYLLL